MATIECTVQRSSYYRVYLEYSSVQKSDAENISVVDHALKLEQLTDSYDFNTVSKVTVGYYLNGDYYSKTSIIDIDDKGNAGYTIVLASGSTTISHDDVTGEASFKVLVNTSIESGGYGPGTIKLSERTVDLPIIDRTPSAPTSCTSGAGSGLIQPGEEVTITWSGSAGTVTGYKLQRAVKGPNATLWGNWTDWATTTDTSISDIPEEMSGAQIKYRVCALNGVLESSYLESNTLTISGGIHINVDGVWMVGTVHIKHDGVWKRAKDVLVNVNGEWKHSV